jgi:hypothetical protein
MPTDTAKLTTEARLAVASVVFPKERSKVDARPEELRRRQATARYADHGEAPEPTSTPANSRRRYA